MVLDAIQRDPEAEGFFISGFPRDVVQAQGFEERVSSRKENEWNQGCHKHKDAIKVVN
jgi:adenylate kinase family enzyme